MFRNVEIVEWTYRALRRQVEPILILSKYYNHAENKWNWEGTQAINLSFQRQ